jgi:DNA-binding transcriptional ArsR family regulator
VTDVAHQPLGDLEVVADGETAVAMLHPTRLRILQALAQPDSAAGLARRLGEPRQRLGYHLRQLEDAGLVALVEERRRGNCTERVLRASAPAYVVDPAVLGPVAAHPARASDGLPASYLVAVLTRGVRELARLRRLAGRARGRSFRLVVGSYPIPPDAEPEPKPEPESESEEVSR